MYKTIATVFAVICLSSLTTALGIFDCKIDGPEVQFFRINAAGVLTEIPDGSTLDADVPTYFVIHGWIENSNQKSYKDIGQALAVQNEDACNVILVDYAELAKEFYLNCADEIVSTVGDKLSAFIVAATNAEQLNPEDVTLVGHSLGGHSAGRAGRKVTAALDGRKIARISALDPAGPLFTKPLAVYVTLLLRKSDASFVDVLHTSKFLGATQRMGHVDVISKGNSLGVQNACVGHLLPFICNHEFSKPLYLYSISSCALRPKTTKGPKKTIIYGYHMDTATAAEGEYEMEPNKKFPYGPSTLKDCPAP